MVRRLWLLLLMASLTACAGLPLSDATATPPQEAALTQPAPAQTTPEEAEGLLVGEGPWAVTFETADGVTLGGTLFGTGTSGVVLSHMYPTDQTSWHPFAEAVAAEGYMALAYDFRGYGASASVPKDVTQMPLDLAAAAQFMREHGAERLVLIGASMGGTVSIKVAATEEMAGLAVISSPRSFQGLEVTDADLAALTMPSLWLGARQDAVVADTEAMYQQAAGPDKSVWVYEGSGVHGTFIFDGVDGPDLTRRLLEFIERVASA
jgi:pimeloyl-ACP methyl ester carboxylesterase